MREAIRVLSALSAATAMTGAAIKQDGARVCGGEGFDEEEEEKEEKKKKGQIKRDWWWIFVIMLLIET